MNAYDLCQRHVVTTRRHEELTTAAWTMRERNVGCLVVVDPAGAFGGWRPVGLLTDRDIVTKVIARNCDPNTVVVEDVMTRHPVSIWTSCGIDEALNRMMMANIRRVPIVDDRGCLAGILALDDIFEHMAQRVPFAATPIRPQLYKECDVEATLGERQPIGRFNPAERAAQPGNMGIERI